MNLFQKAKQMLANAVSKLVSRGADPLRLLSGRGMTGHSRRILSPQEWLHSWMRDSKYSQFKYGFARPVKRDERGGYQRLTKSTHTVPRVNYAKKLRRDLRQLTRSARVVDGGVSC